MKILIVTQYFHPENFAINQFAVGLCERGHNVTVLTGMPNYPTGRFFEGYGGLGIGREQHCGVCVIRVPIFARGSGSGLRLILNYSSYAIAAAILAPWLIRGQVDCVFVYQPSPLTVTLPALVLRWIKKAPVVIWVQDLWPESLVTTNTVRSPALLALIGRMAKFFYRRCAMILVPSKAFARPIRSLGLPDADIRYLPNTAAVDYRPLPVQTAVSERQFLPPGFKVMFGGNIGAAQDFETILAAAELLREADINWIIIGNGRLRAWLADQIVLRKLTQRVHLLEWQPAERMPHFFAAADVLLLTLAPRHGGGLTIPSKLQAYLASGRPIVAAIDGEAARIVEESKAGLTCPAGRPDLLAEIVVRLSQMGDAERATLAVAARRYFEREFEPAMLLDQLNGWLLELAPEPPVSKTRGAC